MIPEELFVVDVGTAKHGQSKRHAGRSPQLFHQFRRKWIIRVGSNRSTSQQDVITDQLGCWHANDVFCFVSVCITQLPNSKKREREREQVAQDWIIVPTRCAHRYEKIIKWKPVWNSNVEGGWFWWPEMKHKSPNGITLMKLRKFVT